MIRLHAGVTVGSGGGLDELLTVIPTRTYGDGRHCSNGVRCVSSPAAVLSRFNPAGTCYACQLRDQRSPGRAVEPSVAELMAERTGIAA